MSTPVEIAKAFAKAFEDKDEAAFRNLTHPQYSGQCPMMKVSSQNEAVEMMKMCPFKAHKDNSTFVSEGNNVVHMFDLVIEAPFNGRIRMAQYLKIENDQVRYAESIFDTAQFPREFMEEMEKMRNQKMATV